MRKVSISIYIDEERDWPENQPAAHSTGSLGRDPLHNPPPTPRLAPKAFFGTHAFSLSTSQICTHHHILPELSTAEIHALLLIMPSKVPLHGDAEFGKLPTSLSRSPDQLPRRQSTANTSTRSTVMSRSIQLIFSLGSSFLSFLPAKTA